MDKKFLKYLLAPFGVAIGVSVFMILSIKLTSFIGIPYSLTAFNLVPDITFTIIGIVLVCLWLPIFISGAYYLGRRGAVGQSDKLIIKGIYRYVRNPMYSGLNFTVIGIGLILNITGITLAGILWFALSYFQCKREEKELTERFGEDYLCYKQTIPLFIPKLYKRKNSLDAVGS